MGTTGKARITYRFDEEGNREEKWITRAAGKSPASAGQVIPLYEDEIRVVEEQTSNRVDKSGALNKFTTDFGAWRSPFDEETERLERMIRELDQKHASRGSEYSQRKEPGQAKYGQVLIPEPGSDDDYRSRQIRDEWESPTEEQESDRYHSRVPDLDDYRMSSPVRAEWKSPVSHQVYEDDGAGPDSGDSRAGRPARAEWDSSSDQSRDERGRGRSAAWRDQGSGGFGPRYVVDDPEHMRNTIRYRQRSTSWLKIFASVTGAIVTGAMLGYIVLSMFNGDGLPVPDDNSAALDQILSETDKPNGNDSASLPGADVQNEDDASAAVTDDYPAMAVDLPVKPYYLLQYGVFSTEEGAKAAQAELEQLGMAASHTFDDSHRVFLGVANDERQAARLKQWLDEREIEAYVKPLQLYGAAQIRYQGDAEQAESLLILGHQLMDTINALTLLRIEQPEMLPLEASSVQSVRELHQTWSRTVSPAADGLPEQARDIVHAMDTSLATAVVSLDEYNKNPSRAHLWRAQASVMDCLFAEEQLLAQIAVR